MGYSTKVNVEIDIQDAFDSMTRNNQVEFLKDNINYFLDYTEIFECLSKDDKKALIDEYAPDFGYVKEDEQL